MAFCVSREHVEAFAGAIQEAAAYSRQYGLSEKFRLWVQPWCGTSDLEALFYPLDGTYVAADSPEAEFQTLRKNAAMRVAEALCRMRAQDYASCPATRDRVETLLEGLGVLEDTSSIEEVFSAQLQLWCMTWKRDMEQCRCTDDFMFCISEAASMSYVLDLHCLGELLRIEAVDPDTNTARLVITVLTPKKGLHREIPF